MLESGNRYVSEMEEEVEMLNEMLEDEMLNEMEGV